MLIAALLFLFAGLALTWVAVVDRNIAAGLFAALALVIAREAAWLAWEMWREGDPRPEPPPEISLEP